jgi:YhcH/YjgK/YiaL family protein
MMILDRLENASMYRPLGKTIAAALDYLRQADFSKVPDGRHELDGQRLYVMVQRYETKPLADTIWEAHRKYIDVQYVIQGEERIGYACLRSGMTPTVPYDGENDVVFYGATGDFFALRSGDFAIFTPHDIHAPGLALTSCGPMGTVRKAVVKCRIAP